jgi:prevent-host-death family protein
MAEVDSRVLHNRTDDVLSRAMAGEEIVITLGGRPVAALVPIKKAHTSGLYQGRDDHLIRGGTC